MMILISFKPLILQTFNNIDMKFINTNAMLKELQLYIFWQFLAINYV